MSKALEGAKRKGREARAAGLPESACPYEDKRGGRHGQIITYSRAFIRAWLEGWRGEEVRRGSLPKSTA